MSQDKSSFRVTGQTLKVLALFLERHPEALSGADIINEKKILSGTLYPLLDRLSSAGVLKSEWEKVDPSKEGRPRKRLYNLTANGIIQASSIVQEYGISVGGQRRGGLVTKGSTG